MPDVRPLPPELRAFSARGQTLTVFGRDVFVLHAHGGAPDADPWLVLHGFPTSSYDFHAVLDALAAERPVVVHDHLGFGLSEKPVAYSYSLLEQAEVALEVWRRLGITRGHLLAHDYGTSVATEILARRERGGIPIELASVTLCNGSVHRELAHLTVAQKALLHPKLGPIFARLATRAVFEAQLRRIAGDPRTLDDRELDVLWEGIVHRDGHLRLPAISSYLDERVRFRDRWIGALTRLDLPVHVVWGRRDPIAVPAIAEQLAAEIPDARVTWLPELGHYPMLEAPARWAEAVVQGLPRPSADAASRRAG